MKILITCPRAPVAIEWARIAQRDGHLVTFIDSLKNPLGRHLRATSYVRVPSPRFAFEEYRQQILTLISEHDLIIPTCEDIFYITKAVQGTTFKHKVFAPDFDSLLGLHNKFTVQNYLNKNVKFPKTRILTNIDQIDYSNQNSILKPVFSRFGTQLVTKISKEETASIVINNISPWIQQEKIEGKYICNYAVIVSGFVISHAVYRPRYLVNNAASTYFEYIDNVTCDSFIKEFAELTKFTGQVAFDFIENEEGLFVIECNPRGTSGLHLICNQIEITDTGLLAKNAKAFESCRVGKSIIYMFGVSALLNGTLKDLLKDYKKSRDVISDIPVMAQILAFVEIFIIKLRHKISFAEATAHNIEYNG
jgi:glutathione synthase/RimK-type ligase-like ATP-grasp enzyme